MSTSRIHLLVGFDIHDGKVSEFDAVAQKMVAVSENEPGTLTYNFVLRQDRKHCRLVEGYADTAAITAHFRGPAVQQFVPQLLKIASLTVMESYGDLGPEVTDMAAHLNPSVFTDFDGFDR